MWVRCCSFIILPFLPLRFLLWRTQVPHISSNNRRTMGTWPGSGRRYLLLQLWLVDSNSGLCPPRGTRLCGQVSPRSRNYLGLQAAQHVSKSTETIVRWRSFHSPPQHLAFSAPRFLHRSRQRRPSSVAGGAEAARFGRAQLWEGNRRFRRDSSLSKQVLSVRGWEMKSEKCLMWLPDPDNGNTKGCGEIWSNAKVG
jgi:hypothetical protein